MRTHKTRDSLPIWRFRQEITLGALLQLATLLVVLIAGWSNLQKELALLRHDVIQLISSSVQLREHLQKLGHQCQEHEYRLKALEKDKTHSRQMVPTEYHRDTEKIILFPYTKETSPCI